MHKVHLASLGTPMQVPNGLAWNTAKRHMYYNDTPDQLLTTFETDADGVPVR